MTDRTQYMLSVATLAVHLHEIHPLAAHRVATVALDLHRLGRSASNLAVRLCNGDIEQEKFDKRKSSLAKSVAKVLGELGDKHGITFEIGGDPRGYVLRLFHDGLPANSWGGRESGYGL